VGTERIERTRECIGTDKRLLSHLVGVSGTQSEFEVGLRVNAERRGWLPRPIYCVP